MSDAALVPAGPPRELGVRAQPTLRLAIGYRDEKRRGAPVKVDYFIAKPGPDNEFAAAVQKFQRVYGQKPKAIDVMLPGALEHALQIRHKAWASAADAEDGGVLRAIGHINFALEGHLGGPDVLTVFESDGSVVELEISGVQDSRAVELGVKLYTTLRFHIPNVLGLTGWAEISTTSAKSTDNLYRALRQLYGWFGPLTSELVTPKLVMRKASARPIVIKDGKPKRIKSGFWALDLYVHDTIDEIKERLAGRSELLPAPAALISPPSASEQSWEEGVERRAIEQSLGSLAPPADEETRTREEPSAVDRPDDSLLNRIAALEQRLGEAGKAERVEEFLYAGWGVYSAEELRADEAAGYEAGLTRMVGVDDEPLEGEVVSE